MPDSSPDATASAVDEVVTTATPQVDNQPGNDSKGADSSPPAQAGSMLDAVQAALEPKAESPTAPNPDQAAKPDSDAAKADGQSEDTELSDDELKALSWKAQQRFKKLASAAKTKDGEIASLKVKADEHDRIVGAITKAGLEAKELDELVDLGSALKQNRPREALQILAPIVQALEQVVGKILPADLQEEVRLGYITEQRAQELAEARASEKIERQSRERLQRESDADKQQRDVAERVNSSVSAVEAWEKQQAASDPDWPLKRQEVAEQVELLIGREAQKRRAPYFPTPDESVQLSKDALKTVNDRISRLKPRPAEVRPSANNPGGSPRSKPAPKTILDAINNVL